MKILDPGMQAKEFLRAFPSPEPLLTSLLTPCETVGLLDQVVTSSSRDHLLVVDIVETWYLPDRGPITPELIGADRVRHIVFTQQPG